MDIHTPPDARSFRRAEGVTAAARSLRICLVGDSIAAGTGDETRLGWHGRLAATALQQGADLTIYDLGVRGDTSLDVARRWRAEVEARLPSLFPRAIVFQFGLNDCAVRTDDDGRRERRVAPESSVQVVRDLLAAAAAEYDVLAIGPAPVDEALPGPQLVAGVTQRVRNRDIGELDKAMAATARDLAVPYLAVFDRLLADPAWSAALRDGDGIHPTGAGYERLAELVAAWPAWRDLVAVAHAGPGA